MTNDPHGFASIEALLTSDGWDRRIRSVARRIKRRPLFRKEDHTDVEQALRLGVWRRLRDTRIAAGDEGRHLTVALRCAKNSLIRSVEAQCRSVDREVASLYDAATRSGNKTEILLDSISDRRQSDIELECDVRHLLEDAPPRTTALAARLRLENRSEAARTLCLSRGSTYSDLKRLRQWLEPLRPEMAASRRDRVMQCVGDQVNANPEVAPNDPRDEGQGFVARAMRDLDRNTLVKVMSDPGAPHSSRVSACVAMLRFGREGIELDDMLARIEALEEAAAKSDVGTGGWKR